MNGASGFQAGCGKTISAQQRFDGLHVWDNRRTRSQDAQKGLQQGRSKRSGDAYSLRYGEPLSEARTPLADFFSILLEVRSSTSRSP